MMLRFEALCFLFPVILLYLMIASASTIETVKLSVPTEGPNAGDGRNQVLACFVIRTYAGHAENLSVNSLTNLLRSLSDQTVKSWMAKVVVMDSKPFHDMGSIIRKRNDSRIQLFADWVGDEFAAKTHEGVWNPKYHGMLYNLTDYAIRECHASGAKWVVPTNGDNEYDKHFLATLQAVPEGHDIVAFDYYSRYQRPTAEPCMRFANLPTASGKIPSPCKRNDLRFCHTDLASVAWDLDRMVSEDRRFGTIDKEGTSETADGLLAYAVTEAGWKVYHVGDRCLVHHSPNPQQCAAQGGVWDDTFMWDPRSFGGTCRTAKEMQDLMTRYPTFYQVLRIPITCDKQSFGFRFVDKLELLCARRSDGKWSGPYAFGRVCADRVDVEAFPADVPDQKMDSQIPEEWRLQFEAARKAKQQAAVAATGAAGTAAA